MHWPLFGLRITTPRIELRYPDDALCEAIVDVAAQGIHDPSWLPFRHDWTAVPSPMLERNSLQYFWGRRGALTADDWALPMAVIFEGDVVGVQDVLAKEFAVTREGTTGSWLGQRHQGQGIGKEMRAAILHLLFEGLGARRALSGAYEDNGPSLGVSRALGYVENGDEIVVRRGVATRQIRLKLERAEWEARRRDDIEIFGLEPCLEMLGAV